MLRWLAFLSILTVSLTAVQPSIAEIKTITATGEYRMGDNDTRTDAKRLALLDAKRLALEQAGTYLESVTEVKNLGIARDELNAYTAGIVEVTELDTKDVLDGATHVIRVQVTAKINTDVVARQIEALRENESMKIELARLKAESERFRQELETKTREMTLLRTQAELETVARQRQQLIIKVTVNELLRNADAALLEFKRLHTQALLSKKPAYGQSTLKALSRARDYTQQALALDPSNVQTKEAMAEILSEEGNYLDAKGEHAAAADKFRSAISLRPNHAWYHFELGGVLLRMGDFESALMEFRAAQRLDPAYEMYTYSVGMMLALTGDVDGATTTFRNMNVRLGNVSLGPDGSYLRRCYAGMTLKTLIDEAEKDPRMSSMREKFPRKALKEAALNELRDCLRLAPNTAESQEWIKNAKTSIRELER